MSTTPVKVWTKLLGTSSGHSYSRTTDQDDSIYVGVWAIGALRIEVASPNLTAPLASPKPVQLNFEAAAPAAVKPETFRVLYSAFGIDITQRLLGAAKLNAQDISVQEASLPSGKHKLQLLVEDSLGLKGVRMPEFQIN